MPETGNGAGVETAQVPSAVPGCSPVPGYAANFLAPPALSRTFSAAACAAHLLENPYPDAATLSGAGPRRRRRPAGVGRCHLGCLGLPHRPRSGCRGSPRQAADGRRQRVRPPHANCGVGYRPRREPIMAWSPARCCASARFVGRDETKHPCATCAGGLTGRCRHPTARANTVPCKPRRHAGPADRLRLTGHAEHPRRRVNGWATHSRRTGPSLDGARPARPRVREHGRLPPRIASLR